MRSLSTVVLAAAAMHIPAAPRAQQTIAGQATFGDWSQQQPGVRRKILPATFPSNGLLSAVLPNPLS